MDSPIGPMPPAKPEQVVAATQAAPTSMPAVPATPPGWYPDSTTGNLRWWDGGQWTNQYAPAQPVIVIQPQVKSTNHIFHLLMSLVTLGLWIPVWIIVAIANADTRSDQRAGK